MRIAFLALSTTLALAGTAAAQPSFLNILPPGENGLVNTADAARFEATGARPAHFDDQLGMYADLVRAAPGITDADLLTYYKDGRFGVDPANVERTETPRPGCTIRRDRFGVAHVDGQTRHDVMFGAGWATAGDRLFFVDVLRHVGRGRLSEFLGPSDANIAMDQSIYRVAGYDEAELQQQIDSLPGKFGALGTQVQQDFLDFADGMNAYIAAARLDPTKMPAEYAALQRTLEDWKPTDTVAIATLIQAIFAVGGGREQDDAALLQALQARLGAATGRALWQDLRHAEDPEAPTTIDASFPFPTQTPRPKPAAVALPDAGSIRGQDPITTFGQALAAAGLRFPLGASNFLAVTRGHAAGRHPIAVMGPQVSYFAPQILLELDLHGGGVDARGAAFPGISAYVLLGRGAHFAWSATSGESDLIDVRVEKLCDSDGTAYLFNGVCTPMTERTDQWVATPTAGGVGQPTVVTAHVERTVHGPVFARATVGGAPVALVLQRSTFFGEPDSAPAFALLNSNQVTDPTTFQHAMNYVTGTFNWLYVDRANVAYFHSGLYPVRSRDVDPDLPSWGTGAWEWTGFLTFAQHPRAVNPRKGWITSWNNKPARTWHAADGHFAYGPVHRVLSLDERLGPAVAAGTPLRRADLVGFMEDAGTVDLRGSQVLPNALALIGAEPGVAPALAVLQSWTANGAHRRDRDGDGQYDESSAVAIMDEWYPRMIHAAFDGQLGGLYDLVPMGFDDAPGPIGSAYIEGYYGYLKRTFAMALGTAAVRYTTLRCADGTAAGCRAVLVASLGDAVAALTTRFGSSDPAAWHADPAADAIRHQTVGLVGVPPIPWVNRPTWQQVVQVND